MLLAALVLLHCCDSAPTYSGRARQLDVPIPRFETDATIDGELTDSVWTHAARLTGFSQYAPNDGLAAADSTQVLVWYSATAIYFGIRAFELHGRPTMTLANRDQIFDDDNVQIRSEEHTSELQSQSNLVCRLLLEKKNTSYRSAHICCGIGTSDLR